MRDGTALGIFLHEAQAGEVIRYFPTRARSRRRNLPSFFNGAYLFECKRIAFDRGRAMGVANSSILLECRDPGHLDRGRQNPLAQSRNLLDLREKHWSNGVKRLVTHAL